ncbi:hypothetical protein [Bifidobacterium psychraerophilum]|uniref:hypothetical protein n=1 Tax=Bifidobacterium psychraerophilum TaxID=218140 RepID=UPI00333EFAF4
MVRVIVGCQICGAETSGGRVCGNCTRRFADSLRSMSTMLPDLRIIAAKKASVTAKQHSGGNRSVAPIPLNMDAFQLVNDIIRFADLLGRALTLRYNSGMPAESILRAASQRAGTLLQRRDSANILAITNRYRHKLLMQITPPEDRRLIGSCPNCQHDLWCTDTEIAGQWIVCKCGETLKVRDIQEQHLLTCALAQNKKTQGTAAAVSRLLKANGIDVKRWTISQWKGRGLLKPVGMSDGKPIFRVWDVWCCLTRDK